MFKSPYTKKLLLVLTTISLVRISMSEVTPLSTSLPVENYVYCLADEFTMLIVSGSNAVRMLN